MEVLEEETVLQSGNQGLIHGLTTWRQFTQKREKAMVDNIYSFCRENAFQRGVFFAGAAHRRGLAKAIQNSSNANEDLIEWKLQI